MRKKLNQVWRASDLGYELVEKQTVTIWFLGRVNIYLKEKSGKGGLTKEGQSTMVKPLYLGRIGQLLAVKRLPCRRALINATNETPNTIFRDIHLAALSIPRRC